MGYKRGTIYLFHRRLEKDTDTQRRAMKYCVRARARAGDGRLDEGLEKQNLEMPRRMKGRETVEKPIAFPEYLSRLIESRGNEREKEKGKGEREEAGREKRLNMINALILFRTFSKRSSVKFMRYKRTCDISALSRAKALQ